MPSIASLSALIFIFLITRPPPVYGRVTGTEDIIKLVVWPTPGADNNGIQVPIGEKKLISCKGNVPNEDLLEDIKWYWPDGQEVRNDDDPTRLSITRYPADPTLLSLVFNSVSEKDAGTYRCTATYAKTRPLEVTFNLISYMPITFESANRDQYATKGEEYKILCRVRSNPEPMITWYKDGERISNTENYAIEADGLVIKNVAEGDEGVYKCWVTVYTLGDTQERHITLQVQEKPRITHLVKEYEGIEGESVHMKCSGEGKPKPEIEWLHRGQPLYGLPRHTVDKYQGTLQIDSLQIEDQGTYGCIVKNNAGHVEGNVELLIVTKPVIEEFTNVTTQVEKAMTVLKCRASGNPAPDIVFHKDSQLEPFVHGTQPRDIRIFQENTLVANGVSEATLKIDNALRTDDGLYNCIALNGRTRSERMGHLTVEFPPTFDRSPGMNAWSWGGKPGNLTCFAEAIPNATISWEFLGRPVNEDINHIVFGRESESTLQIRPSNRDEFGTYSCIATNKLGRALRNLIFQEASVPGRIQQVITDTVTATTVSFKMAGPVTDGGLPVKFYTVQYKFDRDTWDSPWEKVWPIGEHTITVENLEPLRSYTFRFAANNEVGRGDYEEKTASTKKRAAPEAPLILTESPDGVAVSPYPDRLEIKWAQPPDNGDTIDRFEISYIPVRNTSNILSQWAIDGNKLTMIIPSQQLSYMLMNLEANTFYRVEVQAHNGIGWGDPSQIIGKTSPFHGYSNSVVKAAPTNATLDIPLIIVIAVVVLLLFIIMIDIACCRFGKRGLLFTISSSLCNKKKRRGADNGSNKPNANGEKHPIPDLETMDPFHNPSDLDDLPQHHIVSQPLIIDAKINGSSNNGSPANTFV